MNLSCAHTYTYTSTYFESKSGPHNLLPRLERVWLSSIPKDFQHIHLSSPNTYTYTRHLSKSKFGSHNRHLVPLGSHRFGLYFIPKEFQHMHLSSPHTYIYTWHLIPVKISSTQPHPRPSWFREGLTQVHTQTICHNNLVIPHIFNLATHIKYRTLKSKSFQVLFHI